MTMNKRNAQRLVKAISKNLAAMHPPEDITVSQWSDKYRRLPQSSAEPGQWRTRRTPYLKEPMDCFNDPNIRRIVVVAASQVGKSELELNCIGYVIDQDPGNILYVHPDLDDGKKFSMLRVAPLISDTPVLRGKVAKSKSRDSANTIMRKSFPGGMLIICGSNVPADLASTPARYIFGDERDRWATSAGKEGDPWRLALVRQKTFYNSKAVEVSTPTIKNASAIADSYAEGTMERWCSQCPHCGGYHNIVFADIRFEYEQKEVRHKIVNTVKSVWYICPGCGCISDEFTMKRQPAKWIAENQEAYKSGVRSFWINAFVSPWASWESIILEYLNAQGNSRQLQVVYNTSFGELWEDRGDLEDEEGFLARREEYTAELPDGVLVLTCGVDTQDDRLEYEVVGHGHFGETWGIRRGIIMGHPNEPEVWEGLDVIIDKTYRFGSGVGLKISKTFVDIGGHYTQDVYLACRERFSKRVFAIKGGNGEGIPFTAPPRKVNIVVKGKYLGKCWLYILGVDAGKGIIFDNLKIQTPGKGYCHFPKNDEYGSAYFTGLLSEKLDYKPEKQKHWVWVKIPGHERNESLDCRNYALAACKALAPDFDKIDRELKAIKAGQAKPHTAKKTAGKPRERVFDDW